MYVAGCGPLVREFRSDKGAAAGGDDLAGQAGGGLAMADGGDRGAPAGGERDLAGVDGLAGPAAFGGGGGQPGGGTGRGADKLGGGDPGGVFLLDQARGLRPEDRPGRGPGPADRRLGLLQRGL